VSKIKSYWSNENGQSRLVLEKSRGKFTLDQIEDFLRYSSNFQGNWVIILRCGEQTCGGSGWDDGSEPKGDTVSLIQISDGETCPLCDEFMPPAYCPHCGKAYEEDNAHR